MTGHVIGLNLCSEQKNVFISKKDANMYKERAANVWFYHGRHLKRVWSLCVCVCGCGQLRLRAASVKPWRRRRRRRWEDRCISEEDGAHSGAPLRCDIPLSVSGWAFLGWMCTGMSWLSAQHDVVDDDDDIGPFFLMHDWTLGWLLLLFNGAGLNGGGSKEELSETYVVHFLLLPF